MTKTSRGIIFTHPVTKQQAIKALLTEVDRGQWDGNPRFKQDKKYPHITVWVRE